MLKMIPFISRFYFLLTLIFIPAINANAEQQKDSYDIVIIGGGVAGLSAATNLRDYNVLILEKEDHLGGRVLTKEQSGISYDLGAIFAGFSKQEELFPVTPEIIRENGPLGIYTDGKLLYCNSVDSCLDQISLTPEEQKQLEEFRKSGSSSHLSARLYGIINAFFRVIHPGELKEYATGRQLDGLVTFDTSHFAKGNKIVIDQLLEESTAKILLNSPVTKIEDSSENVHISYLSEGQERQVVAQAAVLATPASVAVKILPQMNIKVKEFINSLQHGRYLVVTIGIKDAVLDDFSYIVSPEKSMNTLIKQKSLQEDTQVLFVYYPEKAATRLASLSDKEIIKLTHENINALDIGAIPNQSILFADVYRWDSASILITPEYFADFRHGYVHPTRHVFLAGDYIYPYSGMPYGLDAAISSGKQAAKQVKDFLHSLTFSMDTEIDRDACHDVVGISLFGGIPDEQQLEYLREIQAPLFGLVPSNYVFRSIDNAEFEWMKALDEELLGYSFTKFFGSSNFNYLMQVSNDADGIEMIGYCPDYEDLSQNEFTRRIQQLKAAYPDKKILTGPCVGLFDKVISSDHKPDVLGFELFNWDVPRYLSGDYDKLIDKVKSFRTDVTLFLTIINDMEPDLMLAVLSKAKRQNLEVGYTFDGRDDIFEFILQHKCDR